MAKVTGVGGVFFKCQDPKQMNKWYAENLGLPAAGYGATFDWLQADAPEKKGSTTWSPFAENTSYFEPSKKDFMINFTVENIEALVEELKSTGITVLDEIATYEYGKFVHIMDPEGNKIELWQPAAE